MCDWRKEKQGTTHPAFFRPGGFDRWFFLGSGWFAAVELSSLRRRGGNDDVRQRQLRMFADLGMSRVRLLFALSFLLLLRLGGLRSLPPDFDPRLAVLAGFCSISVPYRVACLPFSSGRCFD